MCPVEGSLSKSVRDGARAAVSSARGAGAVGARADCIPSTMDLRASIRPRPAAAGRGRVVRARDGAAGRLRDRPRGRPRRPNPTPPTRQRRPETRGRRSIGRKLIFISILRRMVGRRGRGQVGVVQAAEVGAGPLQRHQLPQPRVQRFLVRHLVAVHQLRLLRRRRGRPVDQVPAIRLRFPVLRLLLAKLRRLTGTERAPGRRGGLGHLGRRGRDGVGVVGAEQHERGAGRLQVLGGGAGRVAEQVEQAVVVVAARGPARLDGLGQGRPQGPMPAIGGPGSRCGVGPGPTGVAGQEVRAGRRRPRGGSISELGGGVGGDLVEPPGLLAADARVELPVGHGESRSTRDGRGCR